jgi:hypothetical protein
MIRVIASILFRGAAWRGDNLRWEINGNEGDLVLTAANGNFQVADLKLEAGRGDQASVGPVELPSGFTAARGGFSGEIGTSILRE